MPRGSERTRARIASFAGLATLALALALGVAACGDDGVAPPDGGDRVDARVIVPAIDAAGPPGCPLGRGCGATVCCEIGASCVDGACAAGDLAIDVSALAPDVVRRTFSASACEVGEGCIDAPGSRLLLRFSLETPNVGAADVRLGVPEEGDLFTFGACHAHFHFAGYAAYRLLDGLGVEVARGRKMAFCLLDTRRIRDDASETRRYDCTFQGIQAGWSDVYTRDLPCQWVDVTDVPPGDYTLELAVNPDRVLAETSYDNNLVTVPVTIPVDTCPGGCAPLDPACCGEADVCGHAANGVCDCGGLAAWDEADCGGCLGTDPWCAPDTSCPGGCTAAGSGCRATAGDGVCDCGGAAGDDFDCGTCWSVDADCPAATTCPGGCLPPDGADPCCQLATTDDLCGRARDGVCDCGGLAPWDGEDCTFCPMTGC